MRVLSGMQPSGSMHLGNYLGALRQWAVVQSPDSFHPVVDLHALTMHVEPADLRENTADLLALFIAAGLDPEVCTIFVQSHVPYHTRLAWLLECVVSFGELNRMTQFKEKAQRQDGYRVGLFTYPVLMAADILLYDADQVPVGDDQRQHLELTRDLAERFNSRYGDTFVVPEGVTPAAAARVMDLQDPTRKMSKSEASVLGTIGILDAPGDVERKIKRAVTDTDGEVRLDWENKPGVSNLLEIYAAVSGETASAIAARYSSYGPLKSDLADLVNATLEPIARRFVELRADLGALSEIAARGARKASEVAAPVYHRAAHAMGLFGD